VFVIDFGAMLHHHSKNKTDDLTRRKEVTDVIQETFSDLQRKALQIHSHFVD
jgi:hypothetical protein